MSDMHVITGGGKRLWTIVMHFPVPNTNNDVAVNYRTALVNSGLGGISVLTEGTGAGQITTAELAQIQNGEVFEQAVSILIETGGTTTAQLRQTLRDRYAAENTKTINKMKAQLRYFGHTESAV